ncbi:hypothetical protein PIB30_034836 [Stylosanthes scabra]|uniref:UDP-glycosyltransferases domain-containing protein n=1 Tax=Stylosanthes scabra TaxID=79078 RepID=A0ABU6XBC3_9FABA|nr:hypothetical protein [Stylosanthes scabra]
MADQPKNLHIAVFPWLAFGHIIPLLAKLIAQKGHKISFVSTPRNIKRLPMLPPNLQPLVELIELPLPHVENLPQNAESTTMDIPQHIVPYLKKAFDGLEEPLAKFLETSTPHWLIYDFAPFWLPPITSKLDIFRLQQVLGGVDGLAVRSCMEIEAESIKSFQNEYSKSVIPVGLIPPSAQLFSEIAMGLELSGFPFFWVLKKQNTSPDISGSIESKRGILWSNWVPQLKILAHKSVGGFLSHSGWSSVIESLQFGCPLVMLPFQNEQGLVARLVEEKMVGVKVSRNEHDGKFSRDSLAKALISVMLEDEGKPCRNLAEKISKIFGDKELHQKYIDGFVDYMIIHSPSSKTAKLD